MPPLPEAPPAIAAAIRAWMADYAACVFDAPGTKLESG